MLMYSTDPAGWQIPLSFPWVNEKESQGHGRAEVRWGVGIWGWKMRHAQHNALGQESHIHVECPVVDPTNFFPPANMSGPKVMRHPVGHTRIDPSLHLAGVGRRVLQGAPERPCLHPGL